MRFTIAKGEPEISPAAEHLWSWFWEIHRGRQIGMSGWLPISASELKAWADLTRTEVRPEEWAIIRDMDDAFLSASHTKTAGETPAPQAGGGRDLNPAAFDAVFG